MSFAQAPPPGYPVPAAMRALADGRGVTLVWLNGVGGLTGRVDADPAQGLPERFIKWNPIGSGESLAAEAERLGWLWGKHPAPVVLDYVLTDDAELLVTEALPGLSAVDPKWVARPKDAVRAIAEGLRRLHSIPLEDCPFDWGVEARIQQAEAAGLVVPEALRSSPTIDQLVICHGDACAPNTLIAEDGHFLASVDLGRLGLADRWADLTVATMSLAWNYPAYDEAVFWQCYGIEPDQERIAYYRELWNGT
ncbi:MAG: aminoglycoside 3'-phosphotransferase [Microbacteriaceae bacterium]